MHGLAAPSARPCWHCTRFLRLVSDGCHALCTDRGGHVHARPAEGCVFFVRAPGADDEPGPPAGFTAPADLSIYRTD